MRNKFFTSKFFYILTSVFFAIVLFFNANVTAIRNDGVSTTGSVYTATVTNVPIEMQYDNNKYFVSSTVSAVTVHLSGYNRLQITNEENSETRNFYLSVDLSGAKMGTNVYPIRVEQLPSGVTAQIDPTYADVTVEEKASQDFEIIPKVDKTQIPAGFSVSSIDLSEQSVNVTAGKESISKIYAIEADLPSDVLLTDNYTGKVSLRAVDSSGKTLPAIINPSVVRMKVNVDKLSKYVPLNVKLTGTMDSSLSTIKTSVSSEKVKIYGQQTALDKITSITVSADITGVRAEKKIEATVSADGVSVKPGTVEITLSPVKKK
ncbi:CdaR family protein [Lactococcus fujiensis]|uniref:CdaR family protein n=1 Tax=Lactococcus fujiensis TaxID=610251 RepID=UPI000BDF0A01|nr:CdaR family protein [Lactococcus fujiensis]